MKFKQSGHIHFHQRMLCTGRNLHRGVLGKASPWSQRWGDNIVDKEKQRVLRPKVNAFSDQEVKLADSQIRWHQIFLFVEISKPSLRGFFDNHWYTVRIFPAYFLTLSLPSLERMFFLVLEFHFGILTL